MPENNLTLAQKIEAILLYKNEPVSLATLAKLSGGSKEKISEAVKSLQTQYENSGITVVFDGENACLGTNPKLSELISSIQKEELSRDLGKAGLETLAIVLYKGPVARREVDYIRGVNSSFILRNLLVRGLVERADGETGRGYSYKPTLELMRYLGIKSREELPEFGTALAKMEAFVKEEAVENADQ